MLNVEAELSGTFMNMKVKEVARRLLSGGGSKSVGLHK